MFDLFTSGVPTRNAISLPSNTKNVAREMNTLIDRVYHRQLELPPIVANDHLLVKLLKTIPAPVVDSLYSMYFTGEDYTEHYHQMFNLLSETNMVATLNHTGILSKASPEIYLDYRHQLKPGELEQRLLNMHAVTVLRHPYTALAFRPIDGQFSGLPVLSNYTVIGIDVPLLYTQFHYWRKTLVDTVRQSSLEAEFVYRFVLCRLMKRCTMLSLANRYHLSIMGLPLPDNRYRGLINTDTGQNNFANLADQQLLALSRKRTDAHEFLSSLPVLNFDVYQLNRLHRLHETHGTRLAYALILADVIESSRIRIGQADTNRNGWLNDWRLCYRRVLNNWNSNLPRSPELVNRIEHVYTLLT